MEAMRGAFNVPVLEDKKRKPPDDAGASDATATAAGGGGDAIKIEDDDDTKKKPRTDDPLSFPFASSYAKDGAFDTTNPEGHFEGASVRRPVLVGSGPLPDGPVFAQLWQRGDLDAHENAIKEMAKVRPSSPVPLHCARLARGVGDVVRDGVWRWRST